MSFVILPICVIIVLAVLCYSFLLALPFVMEYFMLGTQISIKTLVKKKKNLHLQLYAKRAARMFVISLYWY